MHIVQCTADMHHWLCLTADSDYADNRTDEIKTVIMTGLMEVESCSPMEQTFWLCHATTFAITTKLKLAKLNFINTIFSVIDSC